MLTALALAGWLADRSSSRRLPLVFGLFALGGATVLLNLGGTIGLLILGRLLQGMSAAVVWTVGLALLADTVDSDEIGQTMGYIFAAMSVGYLLGPLLGGIVFDKGGYNEVYAMAYVLIGVDIGLRLMMIEKKVAKRWDTAVTESSPRKTDLKQNDNDLEASGNYQDQNHERPDTADAILPSPSHTQAIVHESPAYTGPPRSRFPPVVTLLKSRRLLCALWCVMTSGILLTSFDSVVPIYVRDTFNWNSTGAGLIFLPLVLPSILSPLIGWALDKYGGRWFAVAGFLFFAPCEILLRFVDHNSLGQKVLLCALLALIGVSINLCSPPIMVEITSVVEAKERQDPGLFGSRGAYAQAYGLFNFAYASGCLIGPIWAGFVHEKAGWGTMSWTLALLSAFTAVPAGLWTEGWFFKKNKRRWRDRFNEDDRAGTEMVQ
jgi:MFS family permease